MSSWEPGDLQAIVEGDDLHVAPYRRNGAAGTPTWIWSVAVDGALYVRAYSGTGSSWFTSASQTGAGLIRVGAVEHEVDFEVVADDPDLRRRIDDAYGAKYAGSPYLASMVSDRTATATVRISPCSR